MASFNSPSFWRRRFFLRPASCCALLDCFVYTISSFEGLLSRPFDSRKRLCVGYNTWSIYASVRNLGPSNCSILLLRHAHSPGLLLSVLALDGTLHGQGKQDNRKKKHQQLANADARHATLRFSSRGAFHTQPCCEQRLFVCYRYVFPPNRVRVFTAFELISHSARRLSFASRDLAVQSMTKLAFIACNNLFELIFSFVSLFYCIDG